MIEVRIRRSPGGRSRELRGEAGPEKQDKTPCDMSRVARGAVQGTRPSLNGGPARVSTGVPSLDHLLGGGLPLGAVLLLGLCSVCARAQVVATSSCGRRACGQHGFPSLANPVPPHAPSSEEDVPNAYAQTLLRYFLAEGAAVAHGLVVASADQSPADILAVRSPVVSVASLGIYNIHVGNLLLWCLSPRQTEHTGPGTSSSVRAASAGFIIRKLCCACCNGGACIAAA